MSWVFCKPLDHVLEFPERDGAAAESFRGSRLAWTTVGAEERAGPRNLAELAGVRKRPDAPGQVVQGFQEEPQLPSRMHVTEKGPEGGLAAGDGLRRQGARTGRREPGCCPNTHLVNFSCARALQREERGKCH